MIYKHLRTIYNTINRRQIDWSVLEQWMISRLKQLYSEISRILYYYYILPRPSAISRRFGMKFCSSRRTQKPTRVRTKKNRPTNDRTGEKVSFAFRGKLDGNDVARLIAQWNRTTFDKGHTLAIVIDEGSTKFHLVSIIPPVCARGGDTGVNKTGVKVQQPPRRPLPFVVNTCPATRFTPSRNSITVYFVPR